MKSRKKWNTEEVEVPDRTIHQDSPGSQGFFPLGVEEVGHCIALTEHMVRLSDNRFVDWNNVSIKLLRKDDGKCLVNCCGIGWLRIDCIVKIEVFPAVKRV